MHETNFVPQRSQILRKLMHFKDWLCEVVDLVQEQNSQNKPLVQLAEDAAITQNRAVRHSGSR